MSSLVYSRAILRSINVIRVTYFSRVCTSMVRSRRVYSPVIIAIHYRALFSTAIHGRLPFGICPKLLSRSHAFSLCRNSMRQTAYKQYHASLDFVAIVSSRQLNSNGISASDVFSIKFLSLKNYRYISLFPFERLNFNLFNVYLLCELFGLRRPKATTRS